MADDRSAGDGTGFVVAVVVGSVELDGETWGLCVTVGVGALLLSIELSGSGSSCVDTPQAAIVNTAANAAAAAFT
ncbi:hypothetical protein [Lentzea sp. E54]|uniref:hypothetical protein n=1 Tax=Lentzea xerophila TaxID=3435883 RepID=UPI003DA50C94